MKVEVSNTLAGYIYWHWMYECGGGSATDRAIYFKEGSGSSASTGNNYYYQFFGAFVSSTNFSGQTDQNWNQDDSLYAWYHVTDRSSYNDTQGSYWFYRTNYYKSTRTVYFKTYKYYRDLSFELEDPGDGETISNKVVYVKYIPKQVEPENYTVTYNANGGNSSSVPESQVKTQGVDLTLSSMIPSREGYTFLGWAANNEATEPEYLPGAIYTQDAGITLFAVWGPPCEHSYSFTDIVYSGGKSKAPTLTEPGHITYKCSKCGEEIVEYYPVLNTTDYLIDHLEEPTCSQTGIDGYTYLGDDAKHMTFQVTVPKVGHDYVNGVCRFCGQAAPIEPFGWALDNGTLTITGTGEMPSYSSGGAPWYDDRDTVTSIIVNEGITEIGTYSFQNCSNATSVILPSSLNIINNRAFYNCSSLTSIAIPSGVTSIGEWAFYQCQGLTNVVIPSNVTSIGRSAFEYCFSLISVTIPSGVTNIGACAFYSCSKLTNVSIPSSVSSIGNGAFAVCSKLQQIDVSASNQYYCDVNGILFDKNMTTICCYPGASQGEYVIPSSVTHIGYYAFAYCRGLTGITIPSSVTSIGVRAFEGCNLTTITIPSSITSIGSSAFSACQKLTNITIPSSITCIESNLFYQSTGLTSITIPTSVTSIEGFAFKGCTNLSDVYYMGTQAQWSEINISTGNDQLANATITYNAQ